MTETPPPVTFCPHGISHQPGESDEQGRSQWCAECWPLLEEVKDPRELPTVSEWLRSGAPMREVKP